MLNYVVINMEFKRTKTEDILKFKKYFINHFEQIGDFSVIGVFMWNGYFNQKFHVEDDILFTQYEIYNGEVAFNIPLCAEDKKNKAYSMLKKCAHDRGIPLVFKEVTLLGLKEIERFFPIYSSESDSDWSEYIYDAQQLATLKGRKFNKKRNHINRFHARYSEDEYKIDYIKKEDIPRLIEFQKKFEKLAMATDKIEIYENKMTLKVLENFHLFDAKGAYLEVNGEIAAYTIGEIIRDTLFVHIEKANKEIPGAYNMINKHFASMVCDETIKYINRSDDAGDEGLRHAKKSYNPIFLIDKCIVRIK